jgi:hypothetical protein
MVNSLFLTDAEFNANIAASHQELYDLLVEAYGNDYFVAGTPDNWYQFAFNGTSAGFLLPDGTATYLLKDGLTTAPAFYKLLGVDLQLSGAPDGWLTLKPFTFMERNRFSFPNTQAAYGRRTNLRYRIQGNSLWFTPLPSGNQNCRIWYVPRLTVASADSDVIDGVNGWEEYIVVDAAIKALQKEESDVSVLMAQKQALIQRINSIAENRDAGSPARVSDSRRSDGFASTGGYGGEEYN